MKRTAAQATTSGFEGLLDGRVALVTGGSAGIGAGIARCLARCGAAVVISGRSQERLKDVVAHIEADGGVASYVVADLAERGAADAAVRGVVDERGRLDALVNNAGLSRPAMLWNMSDDDWDQVLAVNATAVFESLRAAARVMREQGSGRIVNVTSVAGSQGSIGQINYAASKAAVIGMTKSAARELARDGITVNAVAPVAATEMNAHVREDPKLREHTLARMVIRRFPEPDEIAPAVAFLCSDAASFTTGHVLSLDGGMSS